MGKKFEVSANWMKACGKGNEAKVFEVAREYKRGGWTFVDIIDASEWSGTWTILTEWRGRWVEEE